MVMTLRESKAKLSELVERASEGEDVLITVRGKVKARLTRVKSLDPAADRESWIRELRKNREIYCKPNPKTSTEKILEELREDRL